MIYFDNAATTAMLPEVIEVVNESMKSNYGNPSSTHSKGRDAKNVVENARKKIAKILNTSATEIIFTSGGSESDNLVLYNAVYNLGIKTIFTSKIEHHAILHTLEFLKETHDISVQFVNLNLDASVDLEHLELLLKQEKGKKLVSLMWVNNEVGSILDIEKVSLLCQKNESLLMCDAVQGIGHYELDLQKTKVDFITASAHKFHGPKGVGFLYAKKGINLKPILHGATQEHGLRAGTENVHSIVGMAKAMEIAYQNLELDIKTITAIKLEFVKLLKIELPEIQFNANSDDCENHAYHILNVRFPRKIEMFLFKLDLQGIAASGGSACQSGSDKGSHVLQSILEKKELEKTSVRFSFSHLNSLEDVRTTVDVIKKIII